MPVRVEYGQELTGLDLFAAPGAQDRVRGHVIKPDGRRDCPAPTITLERVDTEQAEGTMPTNAPAPASTGTTFSDPFASRRAPTECTSGPPANPELSADRTCGILLAGNEDVDNLDVIAAAGRIWTGDRLWPRGPGPMPRGAAPRITMEPRSDRGAGVQNHGRPGTGLSGESSASIAAFSAMKPTMSSPTIFPTITIYRPFGSAAWT